MRTYDDAGLEILDASECLRLLSSVPVGRLVFTQGGLPVVRLVAFEVDDIDLERRHGWTVTAIGHLSAVPEGEAAELAGTAPSWLRLRDRQLIRLGTESVSGRRAH